MPASSPARMAPITLVSDSFLPHMSPPASHAPKPITLISGPFDPSWFIRMRPTLTRRRSNEHPTMPDHHGRERYASWQHITFEQQSRSRPRSHPMSKTVEEKEHVVIRFAGDSGD